MIRIKEDINRELPDILNITLLSVEEAEEYLTEQERKYYSSWWLRSPGKPYNRELGMRLSDKALVDRAMFVWDDGRVDKLFGTDVNSEFVCVRPALIIGTYKETNFSIGDTFEIGGYEFKIISDDYAWMYKQDLGDTYFDKKSNQYKGSHIERLLNNWYDTFIRKNL